MGRNGYCGVDGFTGREIDLIDHIEHQHPPSKIGVKTMEAWREWLALNTQVRDEPFRPDDTPYVKKTYGKPFKVEGQ